MAGDLTALDIVDNVADFCNKRAGAIEVEIERMGIALGIDWDDEIQVQNLAKESLEHSQYVLTEYAHDYSDYRLKAKVTLFGLAALMMGLMAKSADKGIHMHGGTAWKAFSRALMKVSGLSTLRS